MALKRIVAQFGLGADLRGEDYTKAAVRGLRDTLWHNALNAAKAFGFPKDKMIVEVPVGVACPDKVDTEEVAAVLPYGTARATVVEGGLDIPKDDGFGKTISANVAAIVYFNMEEVTAK